eukprot:NODE_7209_length_783_cov_78.715152_g6969_i0.p2 GENE.NODE_7209_length_783_cov_78.715152_g6969_i0~~NODE_7209_length_783_cov_78.715152_g6969_i0.p2  ORF type:complete len:153 (-),score=24.56 NODE_7209_length_783_cov_78.715152_g6969_i0:255-713(-)
MQFSDHDGPSQGRKSYAGVSNTGSLGSCPFATDANTGGPPPRMYQGDSGRRQSGKPQDNNVFTADAAQGSRRKSAGTRDGGCPFATEASEGQYTTTSGGIGRGANQGERPVRSVPSSSEESERPGRRISGARSQSGPCPFAQDPGADHKRTK